MYVDVLAFWYLLQFFNVPNDSCTCGLDLISAEALASSASQSVFSAVVPALTVIALCPPYIINVLCSAFSVINDRNGT